jgi:hypothetical protein
MKMDPSIISMRDVHFLKRRQDRECAIRLKISILSADDAEPVAATVMHFLLVARSERISLQEVIAAHSMQVVWSAGRVCVCVYVQSNPPGC